MYEHVRGVVSALYEYNESCRRVVDPSRLAYAGIPIDTDSFTMAHGDEIPSRVKLFLGVHRDRMVEKGTDRMWAAARRVAERHPDKCELVFVENRPYREYVELMRSSHVVLDQLYSYTPATNALLAMAQGLVVVSGAEPEYYDFIGEKENHPIVNAIPDDEKLEAQLEELVLHPERLPEQARRARHHPHGDGRKRDGISARHESHHDPGSSVSDLPRRSRQTRQICPAGGFECFRRHAAFAVRPAKSEGTLYCAQHRHRLSLLRARRHSVTAF